MKLHIDNNYDYQKLEFTNWKECIGKLLIYILLNH